MIGVSDGDTLTVLSGKTQTRIRLHGIDAPETGQDYGSRAKQVASDLAFGKIVTVQPVDKDRYGRTVAEVILPDGRSMNREMVGQGAAWWYREFAPADHRLARLEAEAKAARRGLWSQPNPVPPWTWRKGDATQVGGDREPEQPRLSPTPLFERGADEGEPTACPSRRRGRRRRQGIAGRGIARERSRREGDLVAGTAGVSSSTSGP